MTPGTRHPFPPRASFDGGTLDCGSGLLLLIRQQIDPLAPGELLEIRSAEPSVREDLPAWCRLTGNELVSQLPVAGGGELPRLEGEVRRAAPRGGASRLPGQLDGGADVVTDGEQRRDSYASFVGARLDNCQLVPITDLLPYVSDPSAFERELRALDVPAGQVRHPAVFGPLSRLRLRDLRRQPHRPGEARDRPPRDHRDRGPHPPGAAPRRLTGAPQVRRFSEGRDPGRVSFAEVFPPRT